MGQVNGWWVISDDGVRAMLERVKNGDEPDVVMVEEYANCHVQRIDPPDA